jgi:hypothetical protein
LSYPLGIRRDFLERRRRRTEMGSALLLSLEIRISYSQWMGTRIRPMLDCIPCDNMNL